MISKRIAKTEKLKKEVKNKQTKEESKNQLLIKKKIPSIKTMQAETRVKTLKTSLNVKKPKLIKDSNKEVDGQRNIARENPIRLTRKGTHFKRKCSKSQPLEPVKTGIKKSPSNKASKPVKVKSRIQKAKLIIKPKHKLNKPITNIKQTRQVKMRIIKKTSIHHSTTKSKISKTPVEDKTGREKPKGKEEVIFNPTKCISCEEGRQGEGDEKCWGCRLRRLQKIQEICPWNRQETEG